MTDRAAEPRSPHLLRVRWAAIGAAVAVALGGGVLQVTHATGATNSGVRSVFVPITPCRLVDTRVAPDQVGPRSAPLGPGEIFTQQVTGTNGNCIIPADAVAVSLNVTAVGGTTPSFLTIYPADATRPLAASLNWVAGAAPTPNKVDVKLSSTGAIDVFNQQGTVNLVADVAGYYVDHQHDDRYYTKSEIDARLAGSTFLSIEGTSAVNVGLGTLNLGSSTGCAFVGTNSTVAIVPPLPLGVEIKAVIVRVTDSNALLDASVRLVRRQSGALVSASATSSTAGSPGAVALTLTGLVAGFPVTPSQGYRVEVSTASGSGQIELCNVTLIYGPPTA
jgi:hypothetical protein